MSEEQSTNEAAEWKQRYISEKAGSELRAAAAEFEACSGDQIVNLFASSVRAEPVVNDLGERTGDHRIVLNVNGQNLSPRQAVRALKESGSNSNLFKQPEIERVEQSRERTMERGYPLPKNGTRYNDDEIKRIDVDQYRKIKKAHPEWLGLRK
jgi:hypothetical protein